MIASKPYGIFGHRPAARRPFKDMLAVAGGTLAGILVWVLAVAAMVLF